MRGFGDVIRPRCGLPPTRRTTAQPPLWISRRRAGLWTLAGSWGVLVWGGLRGGISIALVLSLPAGPTREVLLAATFAAVLFSVLIQRATLGRLIERGKVPLEPPTTVH